MKNKPLRVNSCERHPNAQWKIDRPYRVPVRLSNVTEDGGPCRLRVDFGRLTATACLFGPADPHSIVLLRRDAQSGETEQVPCRVSEMLFYENKGEIHWAVDGAHRDDDWWLYFDVLGSRCYVPSYAANVGFGDELMLNCDDPAPIEVPMHSAPLAVDWDGDGKVDLLVGSQYSNTIGMPWDGIFFFRNIGTNEKPFFDLPLRLRARGVEYEFREYQNAPVAEESGFLSEYYLRFDLFDWFGTGRLDLITMSLHDDCIKVYRNTGDKDHNCLPILGLAQKIKQPEEVKRIGYPGIRVIDWFGDGRPTLVFSHTGDAVFFWHCTSSAGQEPRFDDPVWRLLQDSGEPAAGNFSFDFCDFTGEGRRDLAMNDLDLPFPCLRLYENTGTPQEPVYRDGGRLELFRRPGFSILRWAENEAFHGLLVGGDDTCVQYWEMAGRDKSGIAQFIHRGHLMGRPARVSSGGYSCPMACDWDGDGDWDLLIGNEMGFVHFCENVGTRQKPVFKPGIPLKTTDGKVLRIMREDILHDADGERYCGQVKVEFADWDMDGLPDLILANNTNRIFFCRNVGQANRPEFAPPVAIEVEGVADPFSWRCRASVVDWDGDRLPDLVAAASQRVLCLFRRFRDPATGELKLLPGEPFLYEDGEQVTQSSIKPAIYNPPIVEIDVCDWNQDGKWDLLVASNYHVNYLENVGDNKKPRFRRPVLLETPDGTIHISHHEMCPCAVDWNGNGQLDLLVGGESGFVYLFDRRWLDGKLAIAEAGEMEVRGK